MTLPDPRPLASGWPETTAYIELRKAAARAEGQALEVRWDPVPLGTIPDDVERAVRVAEDAMFYRHHGIDWYEVWMSLREWWRRDERPRGASTITMQLARNLYLSPERSFLRKARETLLALRLESRLSKRRILELYLNVAELGPGVFGVEAAARHYWGIPVGGLGRREAAELAAALPSPREDNPRTRTRAFLWRAELIRERAFGGDAAGRGAAADSAAADSAPPAPPPGSGLPADSPRPDLPGGTVGDTGAGAAADSAAAGVADTAAPSPGDTAAAPGDTASGPPDDSPAARGTGARSPAWGTPPAAPRSGIAVAGGVAVGRPPGDDVADPPEEPARPDPQAGRQDQPEEGPQEGPVVDLAHTGDHEAEHGRDAWVLHRLVAPWGISRAGGSGP